MYIFKNILYTIFIPLVGSFVPHASNKLNLKNRYQILSLKQIGFFLVDIFFFKQKKKRKKT